VTASSEFWLAVECCARCFRRSSAGSPPATTKVDWHRFLELVGFHRIEGVAWNALSSDQSSLPDDVRSALSEAASAVAAQNLRSAAESRLLLSRFKAANVELLFLKGLPVGALAYGNPALKSAIDIDLLIDPADLQSAADLLRGAGYTLLAPNRSLHDRALHKWHRSWKESVWGNSGIQIDLHTRTADSPRLIPDIGVWSPRQSVRINGKLELPTFADPELFAYLAVHGASSAWFRLKWTSEFAGFLHGKTVPELDELYRRSQDLGAGRAAGQALLLAHDLFGTLDGSPALADELRRDAGVVSLYRTALKLMTGDPVEPTDRRFGTLPIHRSQFRLLPGLNYKLSELSRQLGRIGARVY
jgi:hypothetical protein